MYPRPTPTTARSTAALLIALAIALALLPPTTALASTTGTTTVLTASTTGTDRWPTRSVVRTRDLGAARAYPHHDATPVRQGVDPGGRFGWPLAGLPSVLRPFDPPDQPYGPGHRGVDLGGSAGQPVLAAGTGVVVFAGTVAGRPVVSVDHPNGLRTTYEPVVATVTPGRHVARGDQLGTLQPGHPGCLAAACLHWGVRRGAQYLDPLRLLAPVPVRLLPTTRQPP